ncbi:ABC transporter ATP-binding protein/permease [Aerococcaceae bacterium NML191219]|nr:ABC transporter ATP-binding protein/permease [Aerococcaceae bacterium NML191219]
MTITIRLLKYLKIVGPLFAFGLIMMIASSGAIQLAPLIIKYIIDNLLTGVNQGQALDMGRLLMLLAIYFAVILVASLVAYVAMRMLMYCANRVAEHLRNTAYDTMQNLPISYFDDKPAGKISARIVNDTETLRSQFYGNLVTQVLLNLLPVVFIYGILIYLNRWLGVFLLLLVPIYFLWQRIYSRRTQEQMTIFYEAQSEINTQVNEAMNGSTIIQLFGQEERALAEFESVAQRMLDADLRMIHVESTISWNLVEVMKRTLITAILGIVGYQVIGGATGLTAGLIFAYVNYTERLFNSLGMLVRLLPSLQRTLTTGRRVLELLDAEIETDSEQPLQMTEGVVEFRNVSFGYLPETLVLKDINIFANKGETVALVGHTGSGKSSIMNLLFRFYDPQAGQILIDGQNIGDCNRESVRSDMGIVLQDPYLFTGTIASNVAMDNADMSEEEILDALNKVGAHDMIRRLEKGIHEPVVEKGNAFSSGERQLIAFARTLASNPKILILDEATSHIDTETEEIIQNAMNVVKEGRTTFIIAHRLSTIQNADQILVLHEGEIVERGTHAELLTQNGRYAEMYRMQQKI